MCVQRHGPHASLVTRVVAPQAHGKLLRMHTYYIVSHHQTVVFTQAIMCTISKKFQMLLCNQEYTL